MYTMYTVYTMYMMYSIYTIYKIYTWNELRGAEGGREGVSESVNILFLEIHPSKRLHLKTESHISLTVIFFQKKKSSRKKKC